MSVAKVIEVIAAGDSYESAINAGVAQASSTVDNIESVWVKDHSLRVADGSVSEHRVHLKVTFMVKGS
ncbi:MAG: dodecin domain-containing protein [Acidimicrobiia bacterium]|nr:dodecin domain-containing protein [Acidimicrobiia bacterium]